MLINYRNQFKPSYFTPRLYISVSINTDLDSKYCFMVFLKHIHILVFAFEVSCKDYANS